MKELPLVENHSLTFKWMRLFTLIIEEAEKVLMDRYIPTCIP